VADSSNAVRIFFLKFMSPPGRDGHVEFPDTRQTIPPLHVDFVLRTALLLAVSNRNPMPIEWAGFSA
jgi:hypothetical protein